MWYSFYLDTKNGDQVDLLEFECYICASTWEPKNIVVDSFIMQQLQQHVAEPWFTPFSTYLVIAQLLLIEYEVESHDHYNSYVNKLQNG